jgi:hypothetical protein
MTSAAYYIMRDRLPRQRGEAFVGTAILTIGIGVGATGIAGLLTGATRDDLPTWIDWFFYAWIFANALVLSAWGTAILHGGFGGRRYTT